MNTQIVDPWQHILTALEPKLNELTEIMNLGPKMYTELKAKGSRWEVRLQEAWDTNLDYQPVLGGDKLGETVEWAVDQLKSWKNVRRMSYDTWQFKYKKDAEKFRTLFILQWTS